MQKVKRNKKKPEIYIFSLTAQHQSNFKFTLQIQLNYPIFPYPVIQFFFQRILDLF